jgi:hypothetical protein
MQPVVRKVARCSSAADLLSAATETAAVAGQQGTVKAMLLQQNPATMRTK